MVEAYATGFPIRISSFGTSNSAPGDQTVVGFTRPWAHAGVVLAGSEGTSRAGEPLAEPSPLPRCDASVCPISRQQMACADGSSR